MIIEIEDEEINYEESCHSLCYKPLIMPPGAGGGQGGFDMPSGVDGGQRDMKHFSLTN